MHCLTAAFGETPYTIHGTAVLCGEDVTMAFTGGTLPHVGAVSLGIYEPVRDSATVSTMTVFTHRDDALAASGAKTAAKQLKCTVSVSVGIHVDNADLPDLKILCENFEKCLQMLIDGIGKYRGSQQAQK